MSADFITRPHRVSVNLYQPAETMTPHPRHVMAGLDPAIHAFQAAISGPQ